MRTVGATREAMNTRFEVVLLGDDEPRLRAAAEEALDEVERLEGQLSRFRSTSEIADLNLRAAREPVCVEARVFRLLADAKRLSEETGGAFDPTVAPLMDVWGFTQGRGRQPTPEELAAVLPRVGARHILLDEGGRTIRFARQGVELDLGAVGKGFAVERAAGFLRELGLGDGMVHGGTSSVCAWGSSPGGHGWTIALPRPNLDAGELGTACGLPPGAGVKPVTRAASVDAAWLTAVALHNEALAVSAVWGRSLRVGGATFGHVMDPRVGWPVSGTLLAAVITSSASEADALATALLVEGRTGLDRIAELRPNLGALVVSQDAVAGGVRVDVRGAFAACQAGEIRV